MNNLRRAPLDVPTAIRSGRYTTPAQLEGLSPWLYNHPEQITELLELLDSAHEIEVRGTLTVLRELFRILPDLVCPHLALLLAQLESPFPGVRVEVLRLAALAGEGMPEVVQPVLHALPRLWAMETVPSVRQEIILAAGRLADIREDWAAELAPFLLECLTDCRETERKPLARTLRRLARHYPALALGIDPEGWGEVSPADDPEQAVEVDIEA